MKTKNTRDHAGAAGFAESAQRPLAFETGGAQSGVWGLREAKAQLSEVVRLAQTQGPQRVTVRGREDVFVLSAREYNRLKGGRYGSELVAALACSPLQGVDFERERVYPRVRDVEL